MCFQHIVVASGLLAIGIVIGSMLNRPTEAQPRDPQVVLAPQVGRFRMKINVGTGSRVVITDTTTGQASSHAPTGGPTWVDFGTPSASGRR
jgi:hypothetical protein